MLKKLGILITLLFLYLFFKSGLFNVSKVEITTHDSVCVSQKMIDSSPILGSNFFLVDSEKFEKNIKEKFICVKSITLSHVFPNRINIAVSGRLPQAILIAAKFYEAPASSNLENIATPSAEQYQDAYLVDSEGMIFSKNTDGLDIPNIFTPDPNLSLGKKLAGSAENSLKILDKLSSFGLSIKSALILDNSFIVFYHPKIIFKLDSRVDTQIASLQLILEKAKIDSEQLTFIDLRFDKPIVKIAPKKNG